MKTILRIATAVFLGLFLLFITIGLLISLVVEGLLPLFGMKGSADSIEMWLVISSFLLFCLLFGWFIARPVFIVQEWIKQLARGIYKQPEAARQKRPFSIYRGLFEDMETLTGKLLENKQERERIEQLKKDWMSGITHDMKTPLSYIVGYSAMYLSADHTWANDEKRLFVTEIKEKSAYMKKLLDDLSLAFKMEEHQPAALLEKRDIVAFSRQVLADAGSHPHFQESVLALEAEEEPVFVLIDEALLYRAFFNIVTNALIHNPQGTNVAVHIQKSCREVTVEIKDNGAGMDETLQQQLFTRYYRGTSTEAGQEGTGLGMAIARQIIEAHHGEIGAVSKTGAGTTITVRLPVSP